MAETSELEVVTPERLLVRERVTETEIPLGNGYIGVLPGHSPLLGELARFSHTVRSEAQREAGRFKARAGPSPQVR